MNQKELLVISITIFLTVIVWVVTELYLIKKVTPTNAQIEAISLNYKIDPMLLDELRSRTP